MKYQAIKFLLLTGCLFSHSDLVQAELYVDNVTIKYPCTWTLSGKVCDDYLPGIPSDPAKNIKEYKAELKSWGKLAGVTLTDEMVAKFINQPYAAGLGAPLKYKYINNSGVTEEGVYFDNARPLSQLIRDIVYLETLQRSASFWNGGYVQKIANNAGQFLPLDAYERAKQISDQHQKYVKLTGYSSPFTNAMIGAGTTKYFDKLKEYTGEHLESQALKLLEEGENPFSLTDVLGLNKEGIKSFFTNRAIDYAKTLVSKKTGFVIDLAQETPNLVAGSALGIFVAAGKISYNIINYFGSEYENEDTGVHLILHHYLTTNYPDVLYKPTPVVGGSNNIDVDGVIDIKRLYSSVNVSGVYPDLQKDVIFKKISSGNRTYADLSNKDEALAIYSVSSLMLFARKLDIDLMKKNIVAYVYLAAKAQTLKLSGVQYDSKIELKWNAIPNTNYYTLCQATENITNVNNCQNYAGGKLVTIGVAKTQYTVSGLTNGKKYYFQLAATNTQGALFAISNNLTGTPVAAFPTTGYSKIATDGSLLSDSAVLGTNAKDWACTRDNVTKLVWEVKTDDGGLRDKDNTYSWYNPDFSTNNGFAGYQSNGDGGEGSCTGGILCNTDAYKNTVNEQKLCGYDDWRVPSTANFKTLNDIAIAPAYFPNTVAGYFSTSTVNGGFTGTIYVCKFLVSAYEYSCTYVGGKKYGRLVRLVRGGQ